MSKEIQLKNCTKLPVTKNQIEPLCSKYNINQILASILVRRGINQGEDILYFLENDIRFQHSPFCFPVMEDIVERIFQAQEKRKKVLILTPSGVTEAKKYEDNREKNADLLFASLTKEEKEILQKILDKSLISWKELLEKMKEENKNV